MQAFSFHVYTPLVIFLLVVGSLVRKSGQKYDRGFVRQSDFVRIIQIPMTHECTQHGHGYEQAVNNLGVVKRKENLPFSVFI